MKAFKKGVNTITNRSNESVAIYLRDIKRFSPLSAEEENTLAHIIRQGGKEGEKARKRLLEANLKFVVSVANKYKSPILELSDLISEGNFALVKAAEDFDETRGFKFISFAVWRIRQAIQEAVDRTSTTLRLPHNRMNALRQFRQMQEDIQQKEGRNISLEEFCDITGNCYETMRDVLGSTLNTVKMDQCISDDSDTTYGDFLYAETTADSDILAESFRDAIIDAIDRSLSPRESWVVKSKFGIDGPQMSYIEIAEELRVSCERARQICVKAIKKLQDSPYTSMLYNAA